MASRVVASLYDEKRLGGRLTAALTGSIISHINLGKDCRSNSLEFVAVRAERSSVRF